MNEDLSEFDAEAGLVEVPTRLWLGDPADEVLMLPENASHWDARVWRDCPG